MSDDTRPWEPWTPRVGQRVTVRLSPECRRCYHLRTHPGQAFQGMTGTVVKFDPRPHFDETDMVHNYAVVPDRSWWPDSEFSDRGPAVFAAIELEPLEDG